MLTATLYFHMTGTRKLIKFDAKFLFLKIIRKKNLIPPRDPISRVYIDTFDLKEGLGGGFS